MFPGSSWLTRLIRIGTNPYSAPFPLLPEFSEENQALSLYKLNFQAPSLTVVIHWWIYILVEHSSACSSQITTLPMDKKLWKEGREPALSLAVGSPGNIKCSQSRGWLAGGIAVAVHL